MGIRNYIMTPKHLTEQNRMNVLINAQSKID